MKSTSSSGILGSFLRHVLHVGRGRFVLRAAGRSGSLPPSGWTAIPPVRALHSPVLLATPRTRVPTGGEACHNGSLVATRERASAPATAPGLRRQCWSAHVSLTLWRGFLRIRCVLRSSPLKHSANFAFWGFSEV